MLKGKNYLAGFRDQKTALMLRAERQLGKLLEEALPPLLEEDSQSEIARRLEIGRATLSYWLLKLRIRVERRYLAPGDTLHVRRPNE